MAKRWQYIGDVNLVHGGTYYDFSTWQWGYVDAVEVTDLDSAAGFDGAVMIEHISINIERPIEQLQSALNCCGAQFIEPNGDINDNGTIIQKNSRRWRCIIAYACQSYGYKDTDLTEILQLERDGAMAFDGWKADKKLRSNASLERYVRKNHLH